MRVFVAGPTGVLGQALVPKLVAEGHQPRLLVRDRIKAANVFSGLGVEFETGDLLATGMEAVLATMMEGCDAVIHAATAIPRDFNAPDAWTANTHLRIRGTGRLQRAALEAGVTTYIQKSVIMAYPDGGDTWLDEKTKIDSSDDRRDVCQPVAILEGIVRLFTRQPKPMRWVILRCGMFVGPGTFQDDLVNAIRNGREAVPGDGSHFVSMVHVQDVASAFLAALERAPGGSTFHINAEPLRYGDYVDALADQVGAPHPVRDSRQPRPLSHRASNRLAREVLGWKPEHSIWPGYHVNAEQTR